MNDKPSEKKDGRTLWNSPACLAFLDQALTKGSVDEKARQDLQEKRERLGKKPPLSR